MIKRAIIIIICLALAGCATSSGNKKTVLSGKQLQVSLAQKDEEISRLRDVLKEQEIQLKEKDLKIEELKKKLSSFGVFE